jgi:hypothetical protein
MFDVDQKNTSKQGVGNMDKRMTLGSHKSHKTTLLVNLGSQKGILIDCRPL